MKRQVQAFDDNFERNRIGSSGADFERALEFVLRSDATTKMPTFARGTLLRQYKDEVAKSVRQVREEMGEETWYRNFANSRERHLQTHVCEVDANDEDNSDNDKAPPEPNQQAKTGSTPSEQHHPPISKKKNQSLPTDGKTLMKIEQEPLGEVEVPYELGEIISSDDDKSDSEQVATVTKRRRLLRTRPTSPPVEHISKATRIRSHSPQDNTAVVVAPQRLTIMPDDDSFDDNEGSENSAFSDTGNSLKRRQKGGNNTPVGIPDEEDGVGKPLLRTDSNKDSHASNKPSSLEMKSAGYRSALRKKLSTAAKLHRKDTSSNEIKMAARRSIPPLHQDIALVASAKPVPARIKNLLSDNDTSDGEVKGVAEERDELTSPRLDSENRNNQLQHNQQMVASRNFIPSEPKPTKVLTQPDPPALHPVSEQQGLGHEKQQEMVDKVVESKQTAATKSRASGRHEVMPKEAHRHFCVMQVGLKGSISPLQGLLKLKTDHGLCVKADEGKNAKARSSKTVIRVARKFDDSAKKVPRGIPSLTSSLFPIATLPQLPLGTTSRRSGVALTSPSTAVFSSSEGFSMDKWSKRMLFTKSLNGDT
ncbi:unnamed protein product [Phytophthora lilii]|uniref:Unnamed protein product n=1 Tax=Phytophthora lilii TaxID=2077276 RepID=A0A9W6X0I2_9STRA|nr:unnamed protein product [Phytophthora lilii]